MVNSRTEPSNTVMERSIPATSSRAMSGEPWCRPVHLLHAGDPEGGCPGTERRAATGFADTVAEPTDKLIARKANDSETRARTRRGEKCISGATAVGGGGLEP